LKGDAVLLENSLYQFALSVLTDEQELKKIADKVEKGYYSKTFIPVLPPLFINPDVYEKMARLSPETEIERYGIPRDNQYLIGSAEHTLGPMHMNETLDRKDLPLRYFALTPAFRREAGSYGKDTKGILRQHQFDKLEMESFTAPEDGLKEQDFFIAIEEFLMQSLKIPYQVVAISTGDMGGPDFRQRDIESWMPGQNKYRETHTSDYMTDYQARRLQTKVRKDDGESEFVHMNDATAFAMGRTIIAILENYQQSDGSIRIPDVLKKYFGGREYIKKSVGKNN
jgi:seryl-tRNA synthetase